MCYEISLSNLRTNCTTYTSVGASNKYKTKSWDAFASRQIAEGQHCDFPAVWLDIEMLMAMIENSRGGEGSYCQIS